jgi:intracellular septation protein
MMYIPYTICYKIINKNLYPALLKISEIFPTIIFFILYKIYNISIATVGMVISTIITIIYTYIKKGKVSKFNIINTTILIILSTITLTLDNSSFIKMKPTVIYCGVAILLIVDLLFLKKLYLQKLYLPVLQKSFSGLEIQQTVWKKLTFQWIFILITLGIVNEMTWRFISENAWVNFKIFILPLILTCIFIIQFSILSKQCSKNV